MEKQEQMNKQEVESTKNIPHVNTTRKNTWKPADIKKTNEKIEFNQNTYNQIKNDYIKRVENASKAGFYHIIIRWINKNDDNYAKLLDDFQTNGYDVYVNGFGYFFISWEFEKYNPNSKYNDIFNYNIKDDIFNYNFNKGITPYYKSLFQ